MLLTILQFFNFWEASYYLCMENTGRTYFALQVHFSALCIWASFCTQYDNCLVSWNWKNKFYRDLIEMSWILVTFLKIRKNLHIYLYICIWISNFNLPYNPAKTTVTIFWINENNMVNYFLFFISSLSSHPHNFYLGMNECSKVTKVYFEYQMQHRKHCESCLA